MWAIVVLSAGLIGVAITAALLVCLPASLLENHHRSRGDKLRRRILGVFLIAAGAVLAIPGVPGPGLVLIALGGILLIAPGRREVASDLERQETLLHDINRLRSWFGREPLRLDPR